MARVRIKGRANYDGAVGKSFDVIVEASGDLVMSSTQINAVRAQHPDWTAIICDSCTKL